MTRTGIWLCVASAVVLLVVAALFGWIWSIAGRKDASRGPTVLAQRFMHVKSQAMEDIRAGLDHGDFSRLATGVGRLNAAGTAARWYLSERQYGNSGDVYRQTVEQLSRDVGSRDLTAAKEAYVRLNASCNACHEQKPSGKPPAALGAPAEADSPAADDEQSDEGNASGPTTARSPVHAP